MLPNTSDDTPRTSTAEINRSICLFGQTVSLDVLGDEADIQDIDQRLKQVYEAFLCATPLERTGTALDIGAGSGEFALPFARAFPGWKIWCFEPDAASFSRLTRNIATLGLSNVKAVNAAVGSDEDAKLASKLSAALKSGKLDKVQKLCPVTPFQRSLTRAGYIEPGSTGDDSFEAQEFPTLSAQALVGLSPSLAKITAPRSEAGILQALGQAEVDHIIGELNDLIPSQILFSAGMKGKRLAYMPLASPGNLALRRWPGHSERRDGLDVVVAMYNTKEYIVECVAGIIENTASDVHAVVVDDGSIDGGADLVEQIYGANPRVRVIRKPNGGCASARNYGRLMSDATHIAFVDADDVMDSELFPQLLELARYSGCEVAQGGFDFLYMNEDGSSYLEDSYEQSPGFKGQFESFPFAENSYRVLPAAHLVVGQPTIWRRVYRRDFLDNRNVWFPEHIRAFDDQIFQLLTLQYADTIPSLDHVRYHYRQHPGQDIKQGDERFFYSLEMFRMMVKRGIQEGWNDFSSLAKSYVNTVNWIHDGLRPDLKPKFLKGAAELWAMMLKTLGAGALSNVSEKDFNPPDFGFYVAQVQSALQSHYVQYAWIYLDSVSMHAPMMKMADPASFEGRDGSGTDAPKDHLADKIHALGGRLLKSAAELTGLPHVPASLSPSRRAADDTAATYLDGIVGTRRVDLVDSTEFPFSGTRWTFQRGLDGTCVILNQNNPQYCLAVEGGLVTLREHKAGLPGRPTRWHLFEFGGGFGLCSAGGHLLSLVDDAPGLVALENADKADVIWSIKPV